MATTIEETFFRCRSFHEAQTPHGGYEDDALIEGLVSKIRAAPPWEKNSNNLYVTHRQLELCAALMYVICENRCKHIKVSDVGGGNGYLFFDAKKNIPNISWDWTIFESDKVARAYSRFERESGIKWKSSATQIAEASDVALFSCTLQYLEFPFEMLKTYSLRHKYIIISRIPFVDEKEHVATQQTFPNGGDYQHQDTVLAAWFFSRKRFFDQIGEIGDIVYQWETATEVLMFEGRKVVMEGVLIRVS